MQQYFDNILSKYQCNFCKGFNSLHCLIKKIEKWRESVDKSGAFDALLNGLSKAFDCLPHEPLISKLPAKGFSMKSLNFIYDGYQCNRKYGVRVGGANNSWREILYGVP